MIIKFLKVHLHHFLSFDDSIIDLNDKGYCLVIGINKNPKDAAKSNGSGKSTIWNAISYALVGETLGGLKSNLSNNYFNDGCRVAVEFEVDGNKYKVVRSKDDAVFGTNLKIYINDEDKSGKGIRESQALLDQYLPDLTSELLGSVIILGQGLPQKFTANSPSGRKEVLEHLSKSDFMIQDLKDRIDNRLSELNVKYREQEDKLLSLESNERIYAGQLEENNRKLMQVSQTVDYDALIAEKNAEIKQLDELIDQITEQNNKDNERKNTLNGELLNATNLRQQKVDAAWKECTDIVNSIQPKKNELIAIKYQLENEIKKMKNVTDICPTCGQKIPGVVKLDTTEKENELADIKKQIEELMGQEHLANGHYLEKKDIIEDEHQAAILGKTAEIRELEARIPSVNALIQKHITRKHTLDNEVTALVKDKESYNARLKELQEKSKELTNLLNKVDEDKAETIKKKDNLDEHIKVVNKMNTLIKRDFRGVLLSGIIDFINMKAKEYASKIFNTDSLEFVLNGNDIDIVFQGKDYENLSGGEKQRVDLIVQFAIRDMMSKYLKFSSNILVLDEITDALDSVSCDKVVNFITSELKDVESIFIISHHADELELPQDCQLIVEKDEMGVSRIA